MKYIQIDTWNPGDSLVNAFVHANRVHKSLILSRRYSRVQYYQSWDVGKEKVMAKREFTRIQFVNLRLTGEDKKTFEKWRKDNEDDLFALLETIILEDIRVSVSFDGKNRTYIVSFTCRDELSPNNGFCVSSRHDEVVTAVLVAIFKHQVVIADQTWDTVASADDWG